jgi:glutamine synthetase
VGPELQTHSSGNQLPKDVEFCFVQWLDWMGMLRSRCVPSRQLSQNDSFRLGISRGGLGRLQNDIATPVCDPVGQIHLRPDFSSLKRMHQGSLPAPSATLMASFEEQSGVAVDLCPRNLLAEPVARLHDEFALDCLVGFEIEITFCRRNNDQDSKDVFEPLHTNTASSTFTDNQYTESYPLMMAIVQALQAIGIPVEQMHPEAGAGQYEFVLPPLLPVQAVDTLVQARQCIQQIAATHGLRATCHPQPFTGIGTACHANISLNGAEDALSREEKQLQFMAFVLSHLPGLCAFTMPEAASYARFADDKWKPGAWVGWGTQNRKMPLRRTATLEGLSARWEVRCLDGFGNMYLCLYVILRAGLQGIREGTKMELGDCQGVYWRIWFKGCDASLT